MTSEKQTISNLNNTNINIGTPQAMQYFHVQQDEPISGVATCQSNNAGFVVQLQSGIDAKSGCEYLSVDPFDHTTYFSGDDSYGNNGAFKTYNSTSAVGYEFNQVFSNNLQGNEWATACTGFYLKERGQQFCVVIHPNEINLLGFCQTNGWNYKINN